MIFSDKIGVQRKINKLAFPKPKKVLKSKIKKKAWDAFSRWIRLSSAYTSEKTGMGLEDSMIECYTCGKVKNYKEMSAGHAIGGRNNAVLFDERIVKPQCAGCNIFGRGQYQIFAYKLIKELGMGVFEKILEQSHLPVQYKTSDYQDILEKYQRKLESL